MIIYVGTFLREQVSYSYSTVVKPEIKVPDKLPSYTISWPCLCVASLETPLVVDAKGVDGTVGVQTDRNIQSKEFKVGHCEYFTNVSWLTGEN